MISNKAKERLPENFKGLDKLDLIIHKKKEIEEKEKSMKKEKKRNKK